jgi:hypothetical protein
LLPLLSFFIVGFFPGSGADDRDFPQGVRKTGADTDQHYTTIGNIGLTVTNFGTIGDRNAYWPAQPSCEYPRGSRVEHIYQGGLWIGAVSRDQGQQHVTTGATDRASASRIGQGYEFTSDFTAGVLQRSTLSGSQYFSESAVSHQDFIATYTDLNRRNPTTGDTIPEHTPLGLAVRQESYAWNFPFADFFVILNYTITNVGRDTLDSVYVGLWNNPTVRNTNLVRPGTPGYFDHGGNGYLDTLRMAYSFDYDGIPTPPSADSYLGVKVLGCRPFPNGVDSVGDLRKKTTYNAWRFRSASGDADFFSPDDDAGNVSGARSRYDRMASSMPQPKIDLLRLGPNNITTLIALGPFPTLRPGDSINVNIGVLCARKFGLAPARNDARDQRQTLAANAGFCQKAYDGEDLNGNNILDPGEDLNGNGKLDHYQLPQPPRSPKVAVEVENQSLVVYWDKSSAEETIDPVSGEKDFEGYRIYRSNPGADLTSPENLLLNLTLVGEFDRTDDRVGNNTGFGAVRLDQPKRFAADTVAYWYRFPPGGTDVTHLNGWQYLYGVAAFDRGDSATGVTPLQSKTEIVRAVPGTPAASGGKKAVAVYPNPYYANAVWDGAGERNRKIYFTNLPRHSQIRIYTLGGDVVAEIDHDGTSYDGSDIEWFRRFSGTGTPLTFAGGEHAWDLITKFDQAIATGLYLFSVLDRDTGETTTGKFMVIK